MVYIQIDNIKNACLTLDKENNVINLTGSWDWDHIDETYIQKNINSFDIANIDLLTIDGLSIIRIDTIGAYFLNKILKRLTGKHLNIAIHLKDEHKKLFDRISLAQSDHGSNKRVKIDGSDASTSMNLIHQFNTFFSSAFVFLGQTCISSLQILKRPANLDWKEAIRTIRNTGVNGIFVVLLLNFLIATTLTYEMAPQFTKYGANLFIVNFLGIAMLKEVSPLLTAIIIAGRTGSSITAELGTMKVQEEIDAIKTMGISPFQKLVLPKILGIVIATPLLTVLADLVGMIGGAIISNHYLNISYELFIERTQSYVSINNYTSGIIKSIAFGFGIGFISSLSGFKVKGDANSIGENTTLSVVLSIIMIVLLDAIFAIIFLKLGM
jgi:phospholipid/cholesterol/gamma-HCH transport system permease protein